MPGNRIFFLTFVLLHLAILNVTAEVYVDYEVDNGDIYKANVIASTNGNNGTNVNCNLLDYPCSKESPFKICLPVHDGYMEGVCFQDPTRPNPDEPVLSFIYDGLSQDQTEQLSLRWDIPNNPLQPCEGRTDTTSCKPGYFCLNSNDETMHFCAKEVYRSSKPLLKLNYSSKTAAPAKN